MATPTPDLAGGPQTPALDASAQGILAQQAGRADDLKAAQAQYATDEASASETESKQLKVEEDQAGRLVPPKLDVPPPPVPKSTDPHVIWGSLAMGLAALGSLMTRTPLTTAMNAAGDVMQAYVKRDQMAADQAFATWKMASENAIQMADFQQKTYDEALAGVERRERMTVEQRTLADREAEAKLKGVMTAFGDETGLARFQLGGVEAAQKLQLQRQEWNDKLRAQLPKLIEQNSYMKAALAMEGDPRFQELQKTDPVKAYQALEAIKTSVAPSMVMKQSQQAQLGDRIDQQIKTDPVYKNWAATSISSAEIQLTLTKLKDGSIPENVAADQFIRSFNGANAIKGFQQKMLTEHASLYQQAQIFSKQFHNGGFLSNDQLMVMGQAAMLSAKYLTNQMSALVLSAETRAMTQGIHDPRMVMPDDYAAFIKTHPEGIPKILLDQVGHDVGGGAQSTAPPPQAVELLKQHPEYKDEFDEKYGPGAAEQVLGQ